MAPARMVGFMERHVDECPICQQDNDVHDEIAKITEMILPESKIPKAVRMQNEAAIQEHEEQRAAEEGDGDSDDEEEDVYDDDDDDFEQEPELSKD